MRVKLKHGQDRCFLCGDPLPLDVPDERPTMEVGFGVVRLSARGQVCVGSVMCRKCLKARLPEVDRLIVISVASK